MDYTYDKAYAREYIKYNPDALVVAAVWHGEYLVGVLHMVETGVASVGDDDKPWSSAILPFLPVIGYEKGKS